MEASMGHVSRFLQEDLAIPVELIPSVLAQCKQLNRLPVVLWQKKLIKLSQLDMLFHWLENHLSETVSAAE